VLIAAVRGDPTQARVAFDMIANPEREIVASTFLRLEVLPKALFHQRTAEIEFYQSVFARVVAWADSSDALIAVAEREASRLGLSALDALHLAAALVLDADELITTEGTGKPMHRTTSLRVVAI
jgi:hypothetical protein